MTPWPSLVVCSLLHNPSASPGPGPARGDLLLAIGADRVQVPVRRARLRRRLLVPPGLHRRRPQRPRCQLEAPHGGVPARQRGVVLPLQQPPLHLPQALVPRLHPRRPRPRARLGPPPLPGPGGEAQPRPHVRLQSSDHPVYRLLQGSHGELPRARPAPSALPRPASSPPSPLSLRLRPSRAFRVSRALPLWSPRFKTLLPPPPPTTPSRAAPHCLE